MRRYYLLHYTGVKKVDKKTYIAATSKNRDAIAWYDDGENIFFGANTLDEKEVIVTILETIGEVKIDFCEWGI